MMLVYIFLVFAVVVRFMPHPWQFTPVAAALLFFGARGSRKQIWLPIGLLIASDIVLNKFVYAYPLGWDQAVIWTWYAAIIFLGMGLRKHEKPLPIVGAALACSISFFVVSNFMVWAAGTMYPMNWAGLVTCYQAAVPFFRHTLEGDLIFTSAMFATPAVVRYLAGVLGAGDHTAAA
jgi:Family of unknown function (DUF6580)